MTRIKVNVIYETASMSMLRALEVIMYSLHNTKFRHYDKVYRGYFPAYV